MQVKVKYLARAREISGVREENVETSNPSTIMDLLTLLAEKHGEGMRDYLFDSTTGKPHTYLQFLLDGRSVHTMNQFDTMLNDEATLVIVPPVSGG